MKKITITVSPSDLLPGDKIVKIENHGYDWVDITVKRTPPPCPFDFAHTRFWCGNLGCRTS